MRSLHFALIACCAAAPLAAQGNGFYDGRTVGTGLQFKAYSFGSGAQFEKASQLAIPVALVYPVSSRLSLDVGTFYAMTSSTTVTDGQHSVSGLTDVQLRGAYTLGRDLAVLSLVVNLPTGSSSTARTRSPRGRPPRTSCSSRSTATPTVSRSPAARASRRSWATGHRARWQLPVEPEVFTLHRFALRPEL